MTVLRLLMDPPFSLPWLPDICLFKCAVGWSCRIRFWHPSPLEVINRAWARNMFMDLIKNSLWNCTCSVAWSPKEHAAPNSLQGLQIRAEKGAVSLSSKSLSRQSYHPTAYENMFCIKCLESELPASFPGLVQKNNVSFIFSFTFDLSFFISSSTDHRCPHRTFLQCPCISKHA